MNPSPPDDELPIVESSGNVFADLGFADPEEELAKALLSRQIAKAIEARGWTQTEAAAVLGTTQPKVSDVVRGKTENFSMDRLFRFLTALGQDVRIVVSPAPAAEVRAALIVIAEPVPAAP